MHLADFNGFLAEHGMPAFRLPQSGAPARRRILAVDNNASMQKMYSRILGSTHEVRTTSDGFEAGVQVGRFDPDLMILDLIMPGVDGFHICRSLNENPETRHIQVLVVTGFATEENIQRVLECGADHWLAKPIRMPQLAAVIDDLLRGEPRQEVSSLPAG